MLGNRNRTLYFYIVLIIIFLIVLGYLFIHISKHYMIQGYTQQISNDATYISDQLDDQGITEDALQLYATYFEFDIYYTDGRVEHLTFSPGEESLLETVREAAAGEGDELDQVVNDRLIYPHRLNDEEQLVFVSDELPLSYLSRTIWIITGLVTILVIALLWSFGNRLYDSYVTPIRKVKETADRLVNGDYSARIDDAPYGIASEISQSINRLAQNLSYITGKYDNQNSRLKTVFNNMVSGALLINEKGITRLVNDAFVNSFPLNKRSIIGEVYYEVIDHDELNDLIQTAIFSEERQKKTLHSKGAYFDVHVAPIKNEDGTWRGIVIVCHDITEIKRVENVRKDFVANVSHELRTPLTSIQGFAETLLEQNVDKDTEKKFLTIIENESKRLNYLVEDLLDLSMLEKDSFELTKTEFNIRRLMDEVQQVMSDQIHEKEIQLNLNIPENLTVLGDYQRVYQLVLNLYANAVQYSEPGGTITWTVEERDEMTVLEITDTGIGIPKEALPRIFERFYRIDQARSRKSGGTGLGLSIVKHIIEVHDGKIDIESEVGKGTRITVYLPINEEIK